MKQVIKRILREKFQTIDIIRRYWKFFIMPKCIYPRKLKDFYFKMTGVVLNIENPKRFTEKIQWRKIYDNSFVYSILSDKYLVRKWIQYKIGDTYLIPLLGVWDNVEEIEFSSLPNSFVLKTNNGCATNIIVKDRQEFNQREAITNLKIWLKEPFWFNYGFEMHYSRIVPKIISEKYMKPDNGKNDLSDYKFYCFKGVPKYCQIIQNRTQGETIDFFDMEWNLQEFVGMNPKGKNSDVFPTKPSNFDEMVNVASILACGFEFVRVDMYEINNKVYFGEMTFTPGSGIGKFNPEQWDKKLGDLWDIYEPQVSESLEKEIKQIYENELSDFVC